MNRWPTKPLAELASVIRGVSFDKSQVFGEPGSGLLPIMRAGNIQEYLQRDSDLVYVDSSLVSQEQRLRQGDLAVCMSSGSPTVVGKSAICDIEWSGSVGAFCAIVRFNARLNPRFGSYWFRSPAFLDWRNCQAKGANIQNLRKAELEKVSLPVPSLVEQERLVKLLDEADELRKLRAQADKRTADLIPALFHEMFSGRQDTALSRVKLGEICERITKGESPGWQGFAYCDDGPVFVTSENVLWGRLDLSEPKHIPGEFHQKLARSALRPNDVLINLVGASIGRCCLVPTNIGQANINQAVACITPGVSIVPVYLCAFLLSKSTQSELHGGKVEAARANISLSDLRELQVSLPSLALQREFTARVSDIRAMEADQATSRRRLDDLFQSMLHRAFNGEL